MKNLKAEQGFNFAGVSYNGLPSEVDYVRSLEVVDNCSADKE